ncbi:MAG: hypothetical protein LBC87_08560 [Fibromonadaceae bacterium]|jgi:hypothetical protein|nr:hypothetical protein [Fibromonadaceae bacterium]
MNPTLAKELKEIADNANVPEKEYLEWRNKRLTKEFFEKLKEAAKAGKYCIEAMIESTIDDLCWSRWCRNHDFTYADKKVWWSIH